MHRVVCIDLVGKESRVDNQERLVGHRRDSVQNPLTKGKNVCKRAHE